MQGSTAKSTEAGRRRHGGRLVLVRALSGAAVATAASATGTLPAQPAGEASPRAGCGQVDSGFVRLAAHGGTACDELVAFADLSAKGALSAMGVLGPELPRQWSLPVRVAQGHLYEVSLAIQQPEGRRGAATITVQTPRGTRVLVSDGQSASTRLGLRFDALETQATQVVVTTLDEGVVVDQLRVHRVAETGSLWWLAGGMLAIGLVLNRRRASPLMPPVASPRRGG